MLLIFLIQSTIQTWKKCLFLQDVLHVKNIRKKEIKYGNYFR